MGGREEGPSNHPEGFAKRAVRAAHFLGVTRRPKRRLRLIIFRPREVFIRARKPNFLTRLTLLTRRG